VQNYKKKLKNWVTKANFSLFTFHFSLFFVPLHPHFGKSGAFDDVNRPVIRQADASERCYCKHLITNKTMYLDQAKKAEIFGQYGKDAKDTGSVESQVALFTYRIQHLTEHLKKNHKDFGTARALTKMVGRRRKLLKYLYDKDITRYRELIKALGLRK
jgi:small subunit ribosomal protein S15